MLIERVIEIVISSVNLKMKNPLNTVPLFELQEALKIAITELEKQIPHKPTKIVSEEDTKIGNILFRKGTTIYRCKCGQFTTRLHKYCGNCGQKIDWSEV